MPGGLVAGAALGQPPGFFGKVPSHGDFVGRRIPLDVRQRFDDWLQASLVRSQQDLGQAWLPTWLSSPLWRFVVGAGVCGDRAWAGVMMPSHDRVGRCFPLLLMAGIDGTPSLRACMTVHDAWFGQMEALALSTLEEGFALGYFDLQLSGIVNAPCADPAAYRVEDSPLAVQGRAEVVALPAGEAPELATRFFPGQSAWWTEGAPRVAPSLALCDGMPLTSAFSSMLDGCWLGRGWRTE